jgi:peptidyl-prolyl cis-trans isomerase C
MTTAFVQFLVLWFAVAAVPQRGAATRVIASTKEWKITAGEFQQILASFPADSRQRFSAAAERRNLLNEVVRIWVLSNEAMKKGIAVGTTYVARRDYYVQFAQQLGSRITDEQLRAFYKEHVSEYETVRLSHILILNGNSPVIPPNVDPKKTRLPYKDAMKKAQDIRAKLLQGAKFEDLAKQYSEDPNSASKGGDVGVMPRGRMDKAMESAAFALKVGEISDVVGSIFGFHVLRVTEKKVPSFEELKDQILQKLTADAVNADIDPKVKAAGVIVDEAYFR